MTAITKTILITGAAAILAITGMVSTAEAKDSQRSGVQKHYGGGDRVGKKHADHRGKSYRGRNHDRSVGRALRSVIIFGEGARGCSYEYRKWQATGSRYWRSRYHDCRSG
ncbi:hypothetical protein W911_04915 [Hyphomicrobium nitrativorans NL23]|jgi:hypothetical protein|uniref:Uncharacterized protein n=1 Tax=Hyphomicrobium nitrativorans NL23 TaxID=1029756 RepID=V5SIS4_9HYPH|nr:MULTISPECIES: hypothetical protein [Hyphomicrobium]AHB49980.1 hypothetical protein W911_04915 [Hyphomicrobium nitrativorans NL23]HRN89009.1 hypothetical protein [Hyphomicrobium sp.]HRQ27575.1 hypothetical protein [Hyphomicrobium sp.]